MERKLFVKLTRAWVKVRYFCSDDSVPCDVYAVDMGEWLVRKALMSGKSSKEGFKPI